MLRHGTISRYKVGAAEYDMRLEGLVEPVGLVMRLVAGCLARLTWHEITGITCIERR